MSKPQILIVEDEGIVAHDLQERVIKMGFEAPRISDTADDAITQATGLHPSLVLMDIRLNGTIDGIMAAETIRSSLGIPVVFLTAFADEDTLRRAKASEPYGYLMKPCGDTELRMTIDIALQNHATKDRIASTLHSVADGVICVDADGKVLSMNPAAESLTGWSEARAEHVAIGDVLEVDQEVVSQLTCKAAGGSSPGDLYSLALRHSDGSAPVSAEVHVGLLRTHDQEPNGSVIVIREVKHRLNADSKLLEAEHRAEILVQALPDAIFRLNRAGMVLDAHLPGAASTRGEDLLGSNLYSSHLPRLVVDQILTAVRWTLEKGEIRTLEFVLPSPTGVQRHWVHIVPSREDEAVMVMRDITALGLPAALNEVAVRDLMNKEMETLTQAMGEAVSDPLSTTVRLCEHLAAHFHTSLRLEGRACVRLIKETSSAIQDRMDDLTFFMSLKTCSMEKTQVSMRNLAIDVSTEVSGRYGDWRGEVSVGHLPECFGSEPLLRRLVGALVDNGLKFTRRRSAPVIEIGSHRGPDGVFYFVRDNGVGFNDRHSNQIFGPFQRLHKGANYNGVGLGLSIAQRIIERHGGQIWAEAKVGKGALVSFTLPLN
jgi:PAS domain S-box-containing protein